MSKPHKTQIVVIVDHTTRYSFSTVAKAKRFVDKMMRAHQIALFFA